LKNILQQAFQSKPCIPHETFPGDLNNKVIVLLTLTT